MSMAGKACGPNPSAPRSLQRPAKEISQLTAGMSGADIAAVCNEASMLALKSSLAQHGDNVIQMELKDERITLVHFKDAIENIKKRIQSHKTPQDPSFI